MAKLILEHPHSGIIKKAPVGFSLMTLLFPTLPALFRWDFKGFLIQFLLDGFLFVPILIFPFIYNKQYIMRLVREGYKVRIVEGGTAESVSHKLKINLPMINQANSAQ